MLTPEEHEDLKRVRQLSEIINEHDKFSNTQLSGSYRVRLEDLCFEMLTELQISIGKRMIKDYES